jgi:general secretion pathway protein M
VKVNLPTGRQGQLLALALLLLVLAAVYLTVAAPLLDFYDDRAIQAETRAALLTKLNSIAAELPALQARATRLHATTNSHKLTLAGASDAVASAALQGRIEPMATAAGMTIGSTEILTAEAQGAYRRIGLRLLVNGSYDSLIKLLLSIAEATPPLVVDDLQIRGEERRMGVMSSLGLDASLDVYGFRTTGSEAGATP